MTPDDVADVPSDILPSDVVYCPGWLPERLGPIEIGGLASAFDGDASRVAQQLRQMAVNPLELQSLSRHSQLLCRPPFSRTKPGVIRLVVTLPRADAIDFRTHQFRVPTHR